MKPILKHRKRNLLPIYPSKVKLLFSGLKEADAAIIITSALVCEEDFQQKVEVIMEDFYEM